MDDTKLKCFISLGNTMNFSRTAEKVFMSQQGVSRAISSLEAELGLKLFIRSTRIVKFTPEGKELHELLTANNEQLLQQIIRLRKMQHHTKLRIGYQNFIAFYNSVKTAASEVKKYHPDLIIEPDRFGPSTLSSKLISSELDLVIIYGRFFPNLDDYNYLPLVDIQQYMMVAEDADIPEDNPFETLRAMPFIMDNIEGESPKQLIERTDAEYNLWGMTGDKITTRDRDTAYSYAEMGYGVIIGTNLSTLSAGRALKGYEIGHPEQLIVVWRKDDSNKLVGEFAEALQDVFQDLPTELKGGPTGKYRFSKNA